METRSAKRARLALNNVESDVEDTEEVFNINSLPVEILIQIFKLLDYYDLSRAAQVCKKWYDVTKCPAFWKKVDIKFSPEYGSMSNTAKKFVDTLPACVTHLRLEFEYSNDWILDIRELSKKLRANCPNLEVLIFHRARFPDNINLIIQLNKEHLASIRVLALHHTLLNDKTVLFDLNKYTANTSKIEVLDISRSDFVVFTAGLHSNLSQLKKLRLAGSYVWKILSQDYPLVSRLEIIDLEGTSSGSTVFETIRNYGRHLVELYICFTHVQDTDFMFGESDSAMSENNTPVLPCLKIICLRGTDVTHKGVSSLLKTCRSLQHVYVGNLHKDCANDFAKCCSKKVQVIHGIEYCDHYAKIDYMRM